MKQARIFSAFKLQFFRKKGSQMALKIAYICLCHADPAFIARAAKTLQYEDDGFFIHVDHKQDEAPFRAACKELPHVRFVEDPVDNYWGGFNSIIATMRTFKLALATGDYDRFVILQGQDYPLFSPKEIHNFFEAHPHTEFCKAKNISTSKKKKDYMKCCGFWLMDMKRAFPMICVRGLFHKFNLLGIKYRPAVFRGKNEIWQIYHGQAHFAITRDCAQYVLNVFETNHAYNRYMKHRFPPDEIYIHTIIHNSPFKENVSKDVIIRRSGERTLLNLTYFEYPYYVAVFTEKEDYHWLKETGCLFVRKVNSGSPALLDEIDRHIL